MSSPLVLVTGGNGFLGHQVLLSFLTSPSKSYNLRITSRSKSHEEAFDQLYPEYKSRTQWIIVEDLTKDGVFDDALKDVDYVVHTASPFSSSMEDPESYLQPAIKGTTNILKACLKFPLIKHVVITSSVSAIVDPRKPPDYVYTGKDWNPLTPEIAIKKRKPLLSYFASKVAAEKSAWEFMSTQTTPPPHFHLTTLLPSLILGPPLTPTLKSPNQLNESLAQIYSLMNGGGRAERKVPPGGTNWYCDIRDVGLAHVRAIEKSEVTKNQRYIISSREALNWNDYAKVIRRLLPEGELKSGRLIEINEDARPEWERIAKMDKEKVESELEIRLRGLDEIMKDTVTSLLELEKKSGASAKL